MENQENQNNGKEADPSKESREKLIAGLREFYGEDKEIDILEKFQKGIFFIPGETMNIIVGLIEGVEDEEKRKELFKLYIDIIDRA